MDGFRMTPKLVFRAKNILAVRMWTDRWRSSELTQMLLHVRVQVIGAVVLVKASRQGRRAIGQAQEAMRGHYNYAI
jgi:hypothetical protein